MTSIESTKSDANDRAVTGELAIRSFSGANAVADMASGLKNGLQGDDTQQLISSPIRGQNGESVSSTLQDSDESAGWLRFKAKKAAPMRRWKSLPRSWEPGPASWKKAVDPEEVYRVGAKTLLAAGLPDMTL